MGVLSDVNVDVEIPQDYQRLRYKYNRLKVLAKLLGPVVRSMVSANQWLSSIKINGLSWYLTLVGANQALSNSSLEENIERSWMVF